VSDSKFVGIRSEEAAAVEQLYEMLAAGLTTDDGLHPGTFVAAAGYLAGAALFRSFGFDMARTEPGTIVLSEQANEWWPKLASLFLHLLRSNGIELTGADIVLEPPSEHGPRRDFMEIVAIFQNRFYGLALGDPPDLMRAAYVATATAALAAFRHRTQLDPKIALGIAGLAFVEGSKRVPVAVLITIWPNRVCGRPEADALTEANHEVLAWISALPARHS
jgi:hypothetical protein